MVDSEKPWYHGQRDARVSSWFISDHFIANSKKTQAVILSISAQEPALCVDDFPQFVLELKLT